MSVIASAVVNCSKLVVYYSNVTIINYSKNTVVLLLKFPILYYSNVVLAYSCAMCSHTSALVCGNLAVRSSVRFSCAVRFYGHRIRDT